MLSQRAEVREWKGLPRGMGGGIIAQSPQGAEGPRSGSMEKPFQFPARLFAAGNNFPKR
jgi:hypothetical protein